MKLFDKSGQHVGDNSEAIQAGRDIFIGNNTGEVIAICELVVKNKFSALEEKALQEARNRAYEFGKAIERKLSSDLHEKIEEKLASPDIQFAISEAATIVARKGDKVKSDLLQEIIVSKIQNDDEEKDLLIDHAIEISKRLTTSEIKFLSYICFFRKISLTISGTHIMNIIEDYKNDIIHPTISLEACYQSYKNRYSESEGELLNRIMNDLDSIRIIKLHLLQIKGCLDIGKSYTLNYKELISKQTNVTIESDLDFEANFPYLKKILNKFNINNIDDFNSIALNELGEIIAECYISAQGGLN